MNSRTIKKRPLQCGRSGHGIALIEALIALAVMVAGVAAIFSVHGFVAGGSAESRLQTAAMSLAQDKLEELRQQDFDELADGEEVSPITVPGIGRTSTVNLRRCWTLETELSVTENGAAVPTLYRASAAVVRAGEVCNTAADGLARMSSLIARQDPRVAARNVQELADIDGDGMLVDDYVPPVGVTPEPSPGGFDLVKDTINGEEVLIAVVNPETGQAIVPKEPGGSLKVARINGNVFFKGERTVEQVRELFLRAQGVAFCRIYYPETGGTSSDDVIFPNDDPRESGVMPAVPTIFDGTTVTGSTEIVSYIQYTCVAADNWRRAIALLPRIDPEAAMAERVCVGSPDMQPSADGVYTGEDVLVWPGREYYGFRWAESGDGPVRVRQGVRGAEDALSAVMGSVCEKDEDCWGDTALRGLVPGGHHFFIDPKPVASVGSEGYTYCAESLETLARIDDGLHDPDGVAKLEPGTALYAGLLFRNPEKVYCTNDKAYTGSLLDKLEADEAIPADDCLSYTRVGGFLSNMDETAFAGSGVVLTSSSRFATSCAVMGGFGSGGGGYVCGFGERTQQVTIGAKASGKTVVGPIAGEWVPTVTNPVTVVPHDVVLMNFAVTDANAPALTVTSEIIGNELTISGTSNGVPQNSPVSLSVTDSSGLPVDPAPTASIGTDGRYTAVPVNVSALADGELRIVATITVNGTPIVAETVVVKGTSGLTVAGVISGTDLTISGASAGVNLGQAVTLTIADQNSGSRSGTAIVGSDGSYSTVVDLMGLASGLLTITANAVDSNSLVLVATYQLNYNGGAVTSCNGVSVQTQAYNTNTRRMVAIEYDGTSYSGAGTCVTGSGNPATFTCQVPSDVQVQIDDVVTLEYQKKNANGSWNSAKNASTDVTVSSCSTITEVALP